MSDRTPEDVIWCDNKKVLAILINGGGREVVARQWRGGGGEGPSSRTLNVSPEEFNLREIGGSWRVATKKMRGG